MEENSFAIARKGNMSNFVWFCVALGLFVLTALIALLVYRHNELKRKSSSFFTRDFRGPLFGAETLFCVTVLAIGVLADLYPPNAFVTLMLLVAGTIGQYYVHERIIRWAHRLASDDRVAKGQHPRRHRRARA